MILIRTANVRIDGITIKIFQSLGSKCMRCSVKLPGDLENLGMEIGAAIDECLSERLDFPTTVSTD